MSAEVVACQRCRMCDGAALETVMRLTPTPPGNALLRADELGRPEPRYPLDLQFCGQCHHVQLGHVVDPRILYQRNYSYVSGTSPVFVRHLEQYAADMVRRYALPAGALVADIGSNDGTCLRAFRSQGMRVLGVDPATQIAAAATAAGIETVGDFFGEAIARRLRAERGPATFITSHNACAHIDDLAGVMRGVAHWLADDGLFGCEVGYLADVHAGLHFDTIYHEHLDYHTVAPFEHLFRRTGLELIAAERVAPQGGSIRLIAQRAGGPRAREASVDALIAYERAQGMAEAATFRAFGDRIAQLGAQLRQLVAALRAEGKRIAAYGAPTKATTLLMHFGIGADVVEFTVDDNPLKQGLHLPVSHIPILPTSAMYERRPDHVLILAWNFAESIMASHRAFHEAGGRFIVPMPEPRVA